jgi:hypothetical protein
MKPFGRLSSKKHGVKALVSGLIEHRVKITISGREGLPSADAPVDFYQWIFLSGLFGNAPNTFRPRLSLSRHRKIYLFS